MVQRRFHPADTARSIADHRASSGVSLVPGRSFVFRLSFNRNLRRPELSDMRAADMLLLATFDGMVAARDPNLAPFDADLFEALLQ